MSNDNNNNDLIQSTKQSLSSLHAQRQALESEAAAITSELTAPLESGDGPPMGIDTPLVDADGYPRADIDVYRARTLRGRLATIRTDHATLTQQITQGLQQLAALQNPQRAASQQAEQAARRQAKPKPKFDPVTGKWVVQNWDGTVAGIPQGETRSFATLAAEETNPAAAAASLRAAAAPTTSSSAPPRPFAKVNAVAAHSPASEAGLLENDLIIRFGNISIESGPQGFSELAQVVPEAAGAHQSIDIQVQRKNNDNDNESLHTVTLTPHPWPGRGLLGCHIVPYSN